MLSLSSVDDTSNLNSAIVKLEFTVMIVNKIACGLFLFKFLIKFFSLFRFLLYGVPSNIKNSEPIMLLIVNTLLILHVLQL